MNFFWYFDVDRYALCISPHFIKFFRDMYDHNNDGHLSPDEKAMLFTSMVVQPESLMLKVCFKFWFAVYSCKLAICDPVSLVQHAF